MNKQILYVDISLSGHRVGYLNTLLKNNNNNNISFIPHESTEVVGEKIIDKSGFSSKRTLVNYIKFIRDINKIVKNRNIDIVHFLCGDAFYRFFGLFLNMISCSVVVTYHHVQLGKLRNISLKNIFKHSDFGVVHTKALKKSIENIGIKNVYQIEYPVFNDNIEEDMFESRSYFELPKDKKVLAVMGATSHYKGLDILLEALKYVYEPYYLFIAGKPLDFDREYIMLKTSQYKENVKCVLRKLSDLEFSRGINAADFIILPYRKEFDGASGPLAEAVFYRKGIIGSGHGSLGELIQQNKLGVTFKTENITDLAKKINSVLRDGIIWNDKAEYYRDQLTVEKFLNRYMSLYNNI